MALQDRLRVMVHVNSRDDRDAATRILEGVDRDIHHYDGLVSGWATRDSLQALMQHGLMIGSSAENSVPPPEAETPPLPGTHDDGRLKQLLADLERKVETAEARLPTEPGLPGLAEPRRGGGVGVRVAHAVDYLSSAATRAADGLVSATRGRFASPLHTFSKGILDAGAALPLPETAPEQTMYEVELDGPMRPDWATKLSALKAPIASYEPPFRYRMPLDSTQLSQVRGLDFVRDVKRYGLASTLGQGFLRALEEAQQSDQSALLTFDLTVHLRIQIPALHRLLERRPDIKLLETWGTTIRFQAQIKNEFLITLANRDDVKTLDVYTPPVPLLDYCRALIGASAINAGLPNQWNGAGELVGIIDSGVDQNHPDLIGRIASYQSVPGATATDVGGHGTHVAGIVAGTGQASGGKIVGVAPAAQLSVLGVVNANGEAIFPTDLTNYLTQVTRGGARIVNLSIGFKNTMGVYDAYAQSIDQFVYDNPEILVVVAAGNDGAATSGYPDYRSVNSPATANNVIAVGACSSNRPDLANTWGTYNASRFPTPPVSSAQMAGPTLPAGLSSRGPSEKNTIKPDLLAPGTFVLSAQAKNATLESYAPVPAGTGPYIYLNGTSMAAPFVSGAAAILRQYLRVEMNVANPSAALLKALLIASAQKCPQLINPNMRPWIGYPDFDQGFGVMDLKQLIPHKEGDKLRMAFVDVANNSGDALASLQPVDSPRKTSRSYTLTVAGGGGPLRMVLSWTDFAGPGVKNVLSLDVRDPAGKGLVGNYEYKYQRDPLFNAVGLDGVPYDRGNNTQIVHIDDPTAGDYSINIVAYNTPLPDRPQGYALCACGSLAGEITPKRPDF